MDCEPELPTRNPGPEVQSVFQNIDQLGPGSDTTRTVPCLGGPRTTTVFEIDDPDSGGFCKGVFYKLMCILIALAVLIVLVILFLRIFI